MLLNLIFVIATGAFVLALSAVPALFGGDLSAALLTISFAWGVFLGILMARRYGSAAAAWRHWRSPPR